MSTLHRGGGIGGFYEFFLQAQRLSSPAAVAGEMLSVLTNEICSIDPFSPWAEIGGSEPAQLIRKIQF
jgi:hypothetical protein